METSRIAELLQPYLPNPKQELLDQLSVYLDLLLKWNAKTNLTAIRDEEQIVRRHFGESLFTAQNIPAGAKSLLDLGSGAGFPGIPIQLFDPGLHVTLAESQNKKATFLREVIRTLGLPTAVHGGRAEDLKGSYDVVTLRAVDRMESAVSLGWDLVSTNGTLVVLASDAAASEFDRLDLKPDQILSMPDGEKRAVYVVSRSVPRGTSASWAV